MPGKTSVDSVMPEGACSAKELLPSKRRRAKNWQNVILSGLCGSLLGLCWMQRPSLAIAATAWGLWTLLILVATNTSARSSATNWFVAGMAVRAVAFQWIPGVVAENFDVAFPVAVLFFIVMIAFESTTWVLLGTVAFSVFHKRTLSVWVFPSLVIVLDHFWPRVFPWTMAHVLVGSKTLTQMVDLGGTLGLTWLMTGVSCAIVLSVQNWFRQSRRKISAIGGRCALANNAFRPAMMVLVILAVIYGEWSESRWKRAVRELREVHVAAIQVNSSFVRAEERLRDLSLKLTPTPDLVVWPESSLGVYSDHLTSLANDDDVYMLSREPHCSLPGFAVPGTVLLACGVTFADTAAENGPYRNTSLLIDDRHSIIGKYTKRSLLPFGEYVPGQSLFPFLRHLANIDTIRESGNQSRPMITPSGLRIGGMVCYDDINPALACEAVAEGAQLLTVQVNAADYDNPVALRQHFLLARLRAIENRRYFVRCASTGITCILSPWGDVLAECEPQAEAVASGTIYPIDERSIYTRVGDWPVYLSILVIVGSVNVARARRVRFSSCI